MALLLLATVKLEQQLSTRKKQLSARYAIFLVLSLKLSAEDMYCLELTGIRKCQFLILSDLCYTGVKPVELNNHFTPEKICESISTCMAVNDKKIKNILFEKPKTGKKKSMKFVLQVVDCRIGA